MIAQTTLMTKLIFVSTSTFNIGIDTHLQQLLFACLIHRQKNNLFYDNNDRHDPDHPGVSWLLLAVR